ncbi:DUF4386 domain-containing protein [Puniceibacterium sediminis]|uniref:DUF4386 domain-containing protein n=1 Tax=Puniceibacterium sediminis TaxID=1608407 RepID=A0A238XA96_9RHOB|nr:DUF4386 domain-containing protein [Puniceibacterium sediminis]SNR54779.1 protein of unknown function [Puniceibacterium sediminis]
MAHPHSPDLLATRARWAGLLYLVVICAGLGAELGIRARLYSPGDAAATADAILAAPALYRAGIAADLVMAVCDAGLAILLYLVFRAVALGLALSAMVFRLIQTVIIAINLMSLQAAWLVLSAEGSLTGARADGLAMLFLDLHGHGYDLGLFFFGINGLLMGMLIWRSGLIARVFGVGLAAAGLVYLTGSGLRFFAPELLDSFAPVYGITILAEAAFCLRLLLFRQSA